MWAAASICAVTEPQASPAHLAAIDAEHWPGVAKVPRVAGGRVRIRRAEAAFAGAAARAELSLTGDDPELVVEHDALFARLAASGWIGLAESYFAGEWATPDSTHLAAVLERLIAAKFAPRTPKLAPAGGGIGGEIPASLAPHFSGDGVSPFQGHFATGVPTTQRVAVKSWVPGAGKRGAPARHFVDRTEVGPPLDTTRLDLGHAQARTVASLLDAAGVGEGTHLLIAPAAGGAVATAGAQRGATVDCVVSGDNARALREHLTYAGVSNSVHVVGAAQGDQRFGRGSSYDAVISVEHLETLAPADTRRFLRDLDAVLAPGGRIALQTVVRTDALSPAGRAAAESLRAYIWPGLSFSTPAELAKLVDRHTRLRIVAESHAPQHLAESLRLQRITFEGNARDAAADGFDVVYRRLWLWQLALREALARLGMLDLVQLRLTTRSRGGRR